MNAAAQKFGVGYASGVYDMFHVGHLNLLRRARNHCDHLVVGVASDEYVAYLKGRPAVVPCDERIDIISALGIVDEVVIDRHADKRQIWHQRPFEVIFKGDDWQGTPRGARLEREMSELDVAVVYFPYTTHTSSTMLRSFLSAHELQVER
ncbi:cytidyltransferase [Aeromicrobium sp. Root495]|uniref:adenylyltransferase/cytidyltransferase family protein n=1 Tax=Aeromicrobium sp. Root495 TaxID=1736550 RepID=UPI0007016AF9|nr:adenylyltransferase/cytidyltransferase family protein [Aeromicrobium sp. Root495]KQY60340.1 cytidyltransferase [Aeromicrobium sp. Root495]RYJ05824.1 MAG: cytidyltransferase [Actinomycetales bacterium]